MTRRRLPPALLPALAFALACSCGGGPERHSTPEEAVLSAYGCLIRGEYEKYVSHLQSADSVPDSYRKGLATAAKQFMAREKKERGGITGVSVAKAETSKDGSYSLVTAVLEYADSTSEAVAVPAVKAGGRWRLR